MNTNKILAEAIAKDYAILSHVNTLGFVDVYKKMFENIFNPILDRFHYPIEDRKYVMMYYLNGINALILDGLRMIAQRQLMKCRK